MTDLDQPTAEAAGIGRRAILVAAPIAAVAVGVGVSACGSDDSSSADSTAPATGTTDSIGGQVLAKTADVPVGGAKVVGDVVVTQTSAGEFAAFSTRCPHMGCSVAPQGSALDCPCHGSEFALDGSLVKGPATTGLTKVPVTVKGSDIVSG
ncbi:hypothetical protein nbrc107696_36680 [Gordonia spumicola]|uniref:Cytochrome bc1 complex Rieske iron-sulfur subunit n=1 Tax=Gordonia spumicola TaxID=589161 RepID=A0A7I9VDD8_9ACTN|nr:Rieske (2Fe-2S) protein [Gordonia spumicola]GEE03222.1 hypothetical protein nbrc107696_36680 [Gordonia spumicola]